MNTDEKLTELKKAYADMILNTTKEAARRIMMSERKAHRLESELKQSKENALQMLTRLKQMMDSKIHEVEMVSISKQKKIEELESQLQEAENIVKDLREELSSIRNPDSIPTSDIRNRNQNSKSQISYNSLFPFRKSYIHDQDLPSIISRNKGRKLFRSGCTHRIHACERTPCDKLHKYPSPERKRASPKKKGSDESSNTVTDMVGLIEEVPAMECEKTELPLTLEPPVIQTTSGKVIKYTFQRKRKRGTLKKEDDENALLKTTEKSTKEEIEKVKSVEKSTQEETHLEKVAKQLIALSTKKW